VYLAIAVNIEGKKELLGIWIGKNEGSKFWMQIITELKNRGIEQIYDACVNGLKGFPGAISSIFPNTIVQLCIVHRVPSMAQTKEMKGSSTNKTFELVSLRQMLAALHI